MKHCEGLGGEDENNPQDLGSTSFGTEGKRREDPVIPETQRRKRGKSEKKPKSGGAGVDSVKPA